MAFLTVRLSAMSLLFIAGISCVHAISPTHHWAFQMTSSDRDRMRKQIKVPVVPQFGMPAPARTDHGIRLRTETFIAPRISPQVLPKSSQLAFSAVVEGTVVEHLPNGFVMENEYGTAVTIETFCPSMTLGLRLGDRVSVFGGPGKDGRFASGNIDRIFRDGSRQRIPDGNCR